MVVATCSIVSRPDFGKFSRFHVINDSVAHGESLISTSIDPPPESEKTKSDKQPWVTSPSRVTSVPLPDEIVEPVNEKASTALSLELIVNPDDDASPPDADVTQPL